uniref:Tetratricopeptide repeat protein n=1 Tax=Thermodesulfobacterium geofontis TaxID=1295609 RepID=A0A7V4JQY2_9BACT
MVKNLPPNIEWFIPYLQNLEIFKETPLKEIFKHSTEELIKIYETSKDLLPLLLAERFLWENIEDNFFSYKLLNLVLKKRKVFGYLFFFPCKNFWNKNKKILSEYFFIKFSENYYFYPSEWGNAFKILISLWKEKAKFFSVEVNLYKEPSEEYIKNNLKLAQILEFSYLSQKALKFLKNYLPTFEVEKLSEITDKFLKTKESSLVLSSKKDIKKDLKRVGAKIIKELEGENKLLLVKNLDLNQIIWLYEKNLDINKTGVLPWEVWKKFKNKDSTPLIFLIGAFEHAKRINQISIKVFEGFTYHVLGDLYYEWKDLGKALKYYLLARNYTKQPIELALSESAIYYTFGDLDRAEKILRKELCGCKKEDPLIHYNLALIYLKKEKGEEAKYHLYKAHLLDPENIIFREALIKYLWDFEEYEELGDFLNSLKNLSLKEKIYFGKFYFYKKEYEKAFKYLKDVLTFKERDGETLLFLAWLYLYFNKEKEISQILLKEAQEMLSSEELEKIKKEFGLEI